MAAKLAIKASTMDAIQQMAIKLTLSQWTACQYIPTPQMDAIVDSDVDCGTCIMFATKRLAEAANMMIRTE